MLLTACGCAPAPGNKRLSPIAVATIRSGITTKAQVRTLLGAPQSMDRQLPIRQPAGGEPLPVKYVASEIWEYSTTINPRHLLSASASDRQEKYFVVIYFDERGVVLDCETEVTTS